MDRVKRNAVPYWQQPFFRIKHDSLELLPSTKLILTAILSTFAAIFQSAGGYMPGIGFFLSTMTTLPIFLATSVSVRHGFLSYLVTILLLLLIQPSELIIFPFTTGILGVAIGFSIYRLETKFWVVICSGASLFMGIILLLFVFRFPVLGPGVDPSFHLLSLILIAFFSITYAWIAAVGCSFVLKRLTHALPIRGSKAASNQGLDNIKGSTKEKNVEVKK